MPSQNVQIDHRTRSASVCVVGQIAEHVLHQNARRLNGVVRVSSAGQQLLGDLQQIRIWRIAARIVYAAVHVVVLAVLNGRTPINVVNRNRSSTTV